MPSALLTTAPPSPGMFFTHASTRAPPSCFAHMLCRGGRHLAAPERERSGCGRCEGYPGGSPHEARRCRGRDGLSPQSLVWHQGRETQPVPQPLETSGRSCSSTAPCPVSACAATGTAPPSSAAASPSAWARVFVRGTCGIVYCRTHERDKQTEDVREKDRT